MLSGMRAAWWNASRAILMPLTHFIHLLKNRHLSILLLCSVFFLLPKISPAADNPTGPSQMEPPVNEDVIRGIEFLYNWEFDQAEGLFEQLTRESPEDPMGYFYLAMVSWSHLASGFWTKEMVTEYGRRIDKSIDVAKKAVKKNENDCFAHFYLGGALGFEGRFKLMERKWLSSFLLAQDAIKALKTSQAKCPDNQDVLFGLGIFDYYTARLSGVLKFLSYLLVHRGDKAEGLRKLHLAAEGAVYSSIEAKSLLLHIYLFMEKNLYENALILSVDLTKRFPNNPRFKFLEGISYIRLDMDTEYMGIVNFFREKSNSLPSKRDAFIWGSRGVYLEACYDLFHNRLDEARSKLEAILSLADPTSDPSMVAWPQLKLGMSYDLESAREKALTHYNRILKLENGAGAQFLAEKYKKKPAKRMDPFLGY
jgi:tetratricopeptide (TPR) repeat protein